MTILLETEFQIGDIVKSRLDAEFTYIVNNFTIMAIDENGTTLCYLIDCADPEGAIRVFRPYEVEIVEKIRI